MTGLDSLAMLAGAAPVKAVSAAAFGASVVLDRRAVSEQPPPEGINPFGHVGKDEEHVGRITESLKQINRLHPKWSQS